MGLTVTLIMAIMRTSCDNDPVGYDGVNRADGNQTCDQTADFVSSEANRLELRVQVRAQP